MRIALAVEGTRGDVHPMLDLGRAFQSLGHEVRLCGSANFAGDSHDAGIEFREIGRDTRAFLDEMAGAVSSRGLDALRCQQAYFDESFTRQFERLPDATRDCDLILGAGVQLAGPSAGELHGIPYRFVAYCPVMLPAAEHAPIFLPLQGLPPILNRLAWWITRHAIDPVIRHRLHRERRSLGLPKVRRAMDHVLSPRVLMASDPMLAPIAPSNRHPAIQIGCIHAHEPKALPDKLEAFLSAGSPPIYFGFGSMTDPAPEKTTRVILDAVEAVGCRAILSRGWAGLAEGPLDERVISIGPVSHAALFPRVAGVVHHGGAGTTTRAAQAGSPQILVPHLLDQYWWGRQVQALGLSPRPIPRATLTASRLANALEAVLENEFLSHRAREIADRIRPAARPTTAAETLLHSLES